MTHEEYEALLDSFLKKLERTVVLKYRHYLGAFVQNMICPLQKKTIGSLNKKVCHISLGALQGACAEMKTDIRFLINRREKLVDRLRLSFGKVAGVVAYRLTKAHVIHLHEGCASCAEPCNAPKLNQIFALRCAWEYICIQYHRVPDDIRRELFYSFSSRHINQETLGLVFDTIHTKHSQTASLPPAS